MRGVECEIHQRSFSFIASRPASSSGWIAVADVVEPLPDRLAVEVAVVDALEDRGELERREAEVEAEAGQVAVGAGGVARDDLVLGEEPGRRRDVGDRGAADRRAEPVVDQHQRQVGERVAEGGHLPVENGRRAVVVVDEHVVEPEVAVHDAGSRLDRDVRGQQPVELVGRREVAVVRRVELLLPPRDLTAEVALGTAEVAEPDRERVDGVQRGEGVDEPDGDGPGALRAERRRARSARRYGVPATRSIT